MERGPVREQDGFVPFAVIGFQVGAAGLAVVDAQAALAVDRVASEALRVLLAEWAFRPAEAPSRRALAAREQPPPARVAARELRHRRKRPARRAVASQPAVVVAQRAKPSSTGRSEADSASQPAQCSSPAAGGIQRS